MDPVGIVLKLKSGQKKNGGTWTHAATQVPPPISLLYV